MSVAAADDVALDRVMLAMDVVDTLRHQHAIVDAELDDERRQRELVARIRAIYDSQGIEVSDEVIAEGVAALRADRFVYTRPERTFRVRLAEAYVDRRKWAIRLGIVALVGVLIWSSYAVPAYFREQGRRKAFEQSVAALSVRGRELAEQGSAIEQELGRALAAVKLPAMRRLLRDAEDALLAGQGQTESLAAALATLPAAEGYLRDRARWDESLESFAQLAGEASAAYGQARGLLGAVGSLRSMKNELDAVLQRLAGVELSTSESAAIAAAQKRVEAAIQTGDAHAGEAAMVALDRLIDAALAARQREAEIRARFAALSSAFDEVAIEPAAEQQLAELRRSVEGAIAAGDWARAGTAVDRMGELVDRLDLAYELRIVSKPGSRSGVWRLPPDRRGRNYYIVVEARGNDGKPLALPIESEEDHEVRRVPVFGIRVPEAVYEQVKADKLDNGIVDQALFGTKRRGRLEPEYRFEVAGGKITRW
ncbi:MAG: hypothetical protein KDE27_23650 [Planctomycetes bacterium]|nr:hypothetical protein [Planctomycetota bacterium]